MPRLTAWDRFGSSMQTVLADLIRRRDEAQRIKREQEQQAFVNMLAGRGMELDEAANRRAQEAAERGAEQWDIQKEQIGQENLRNVYESILAPTLEGRAAEEHQVQMGLLGAQTGAYDALRQQRLRPDQPSLNLPQYGSKEWAFAQAIQNVPEDQQQAAFLQYLGLGQEQQVPDRVIQEALKAAISERYDPDDPMNLTTDINWELFKAYIEGYKRVAGR